MATQASEEGRRASGSSKDLAPSQTTEYCGRLQEWMWQYYCGYVSWQSWLALFASPLPSCTVQTGDEPRWPPNQYTPDAYSGYHSWFNAAASASAGPPTGARAPHAPSGDAAAAQNAVQQQDGNAQQRGQEYTIPSPLHRFCAEVLDFVILFCTKAAIVLTVMHLSGMKDMSKLAMHFIVEEIDEDTSVEELQKMMVVALVYRVLVCIYEIICIWGAGGATPGKFLLGLRVVTCDTVVLVRPGRVRVAPASDVSLSASTVRALSKNFSIAFFFPAFVTLLFFQHNRTVYDIVAGTIVVKRGEPR